MEKLSPRTAALATAAFSFAAHGFLFANEFFSHDSVSYFAYADWGADFYAAAGRFLIPLLEALKGPAASPWLTGVLFVGWMSLAGVCVCRTLEIHTRAGAALACGALVGNTALALTGATYVYCLDEYAAAFALAALAAALFRRGTVRSSLAGVGAMVGSLALYQPYFTAGAALCLLGLLRCLLREGKWRDILRRGLVQLGLLAASFLLYYLAWGGVCAALGCARRRTGESVLAGGPGVLPGLAAEANAEFFRELFRPGVLGWLGPAAGAALLLALLAGLGRALGDRRRGAGEKILLLALAALVPTALSSAAILLPGEAHGLTVCARDLWLLLPVCLFEDLSASGRQRAAAMALAVLTGVCLWQRIVFSNQLYMKKELEKNATLVLSAQIVGRIESLEGYVPGETPVAFAGRLDENPFLASRRAAFADLYNLTGQWSHWSATYNLGRYLTDYLRYPLRWDTERDYASLPAVAAMPLYPAAGSVALIDGTAVVRLS